MSEASPPRPSAAEALSPEERERWVRDGFFVRRAAFGAPELRGLRDAADRVDALASSWSGRGRAYRIDGYRFRDVEGTTLQYEHGEDASTTGLARVLEPVHLLDPVFESLVDDPRLTQPARGLVGSSELSLFTDKLNLKRPRVGSAFRWHQDSPYWAHHPGAWERIDRLPNVLVQLDVSSDTNGCFSVYVGSHRQGALPGTCDGSVLGPLFTDPARLDASTERPLPLPAGSLVFFHPHLVHGSRPNRSGRARRAVVLTYQAPGLRMFKLDRVREVAA